MARPTKTGLDYFPLDVDMDNDDKIALIEAKYGLTGFAIIIKMLMKIYDNSYFYEWSEKEQLLFSKRVYVDINLLNDVINDCLKWDLFSEEIFKSSRILTSRAIQERYLEASSRRKQVEISRNHLLIESERVNVYKNLVIVDINNQSDELMYEKSTQSKVEESKVNESKVKSTTTREKYFEKTLLEKYLELREKYFAKSSLMPNEKDRMAAEEIKNSGIDLKDALYWLEECFKNYESTHSNKSINTLGYCVGYILDRHHEAQNKVVGLDGRRLRVDEIDWENI